MVSTIALSLPMEDITTPNQIASSAANNLRDPEPREIERIIAASDLAQATHEPKTSCKGRLFFEWHAF